MVGAKIKWRERTKAQRTTSSSPSMKMHHALPCTMHHAPCMSILVSSHWHRVRVGTVISDLRIKASISSDDNHWLVIALALDIPRINNEGDSNNISASPIVFIA